MREANQEEHHARCWQWDAIYLIGWFAVWLGWCFVVVGFAGMLAGVAFLENILPLGPVGVIYSSRTIPLISLSVGLEVAGGFLVILSEFLKQALQVRVSTRPQEQERELS